MVIVISGTERMSEEWEHEDENESSSSSGGEDNSEVLEKVSPVKKHSVNSLCKIDDISCCVYCLSKLSEFNADYPPATTQICLNVPNSHMSMRVKVC